MTGAGGWRWSGHRMPRIIHILQIIAIHSVSPLARNSQHIELHWRPRRVMGA